MLITKFAILIIVQLNCALKLTFKSLVLTCKFIVNNCELRNVT